MYSSGRYVVESVNEVRVHIISDSESLIMHTYLVTPNALIGGELLYVCVCP